jgi:hypothetical protein
MKTLGKRLEECGFLAHHDKNRNTSQVTIGTTRRRVWAIKKSDIFPPSKEPPSGRSSSEGVFGA